MNVDYTQLDPKPLPLLWLAYDLHASSVLPWLILDGNADDRVYCRAPSLDAAVRFVRAAEANGDATADEQSIEWQLAFRASFDHSVRVDEASIVLSEREWKPVVSGGDGSGTPEPMPERFDSATSRSESATTSSREEPTTVEAANLPLPVPQAVARSNEPASSLDNILPFDRGAA